MAEQQLDKQFSLSQVKREGRATILTSVKMTAHGRELQRARRESFLPHPDLSITQVRNPRGGTQDLSGDVFRCLRSQWSQVEGWLEVSAGLVSSPLRVCN